MKGKTSGHLRGQQAGHFSERLAEFLGGLKTIGRRLRERPLKDRSAPIGQAFTMPVQRHGRVRDLLPQRGSRGGALKGETACQQPIKDHAD